MSSTSRSSSTSSRRSGSAVAPAFSVRSVAKVSASAGVSQQLQAIADFRARDGSVASAVSRVKGKAADVAKAAEARQAAEAWAATAERLRREGADREGEFRDAWARMDETLFLQHDTLQHGGAAPGAADGLGWLRRQIKAEGDALTRAFAPAAQQDHLSKHPHVVASRICAATRQELAPLASAAASDASARKISTTSSSLLSAPRFPLSQRSQQQPRCTLGDQQRAEAGSILAQVAACRQQELDASARCEEELAVLSAELAAVQQQQQNEHQQLGSGGALAPWFLERVRAAPLAAVTRDWLAGYDTIRALQPRLFDVFHEHVAAQQAAIDALAAAAAGTREALLESGDARSLDRLWQLWSSAPRGVGAGGRSRRERVLQLARTEGCAPGGDADAALDLLVALAAQRQQCRARYGAAVESVMQQMRRLDDVVASLAAVVEAEAVHGAFLTGLRQEQQATQERVAQLQAERDRVEAARAAERAADEEEQARRAAAERDRWERTLREQQERVAAWLGEKAAKAQAEEEAAAEAARAREAEHREELRLGAERVQQRRAVDAARQQQQAAAAAAVQAEREAQERRLEGFYAKRDEEVGVVRDPQRVVQATATSEATAALPTVNEAARQYASTGHGYSNHAIVRDARFRLHEALSMAGLQNTAYGRSVIANSGATKPHLQVSNAKLW